MIFSTCKKTELRMVRGSSQVIQVQVRTPSGQPYTLLEGDVIRFGVKYDENASAYLLKKETTELTGGVSFINIEAEDTIGMEVGKYKFDIGLQSGQYYFPIVKFSDFILEPNITAKE